ncbi:MAG: cation:proton antiporter [Chloroflexi bacterium]|nr:cation:proton antiporter [Chloroflexota bacterium]
MEELPVLELLIALAIVLVAAKGAGILAIRFGQPAVLGELAVGVILGPSLLDMFGREFLEEAHLEETVLLLKELGVVFLMFLAGLETDLSEVAKVRKVAILAGTMGVIFPLVFGSLGALPFGFEAKEAIFVGIILSATSVSISARTLMEIGVLQKRQGISILAAAVIDDVLVILVLSFFVAFAVDTGDGGGGVTEVLTIVGRVALFFAAATIVGLLVVPRLASWSANAPMSEGVLVTAIVVMLVYSWFAEEVGGVALITGAFMAGLLLRRTNVHRVIDEKMRTIAYGFFVPIFFVGVGLSADAGGFEVSDIVLLAVISVIAVVSKVIGSGLGARLAGEDIRSSVQIGTGMISRGEVGLIVASVGLAQGLVDQNLFSVMVLMVLVTTLVTPVLLKIVFAEEKEAEYA